MDCKNISSLCDQMKNCFIKFLLAQDNHDDK